MGCDHRAGRHRNGTRQSVWRHAAFGHQTRDWPLDTQRWVYDPAKFCDQSDPDPRHGHELSGIHDIICTRGRYRNVPNRAQPIGKPSGRDIASSGAHIPNGVYDDFGKNGLNSGSGICEMSMSPSLRNRSVTLPQHFVFISKDLCIMRGPLFDQGRA